MKALKFILGICLSLAILLIPITQAQTSNLDSLKTLAVQLDGRKKPLDTVARETVAEIHGRETYQAQSGETLDYLETYLSLWFNNRDWNQEPFVLVSYRPLKEFLGLNLEQKYFTFQELMRSSLSSLTLSAQQKQAQDIDLTRNEREALTIADRLALMMATVGSQSLPIVPHPSEIKGTWVGIDQAQDYYPENQAALVQSQYEALRQFYRSSPEHLGNINPFATKLHQQLQSLSPAIYPQDRVLQREVNFFALHPFGQAWKLYVLAFVVLAVTLMFPALDLYWGVIGIFATGLTVQGYGFMERMAIAGRPPVTNMYESVIWVGFGIAAIALIFELIYRAKYYLLAAAPLSVVCLVLADRLPAVLDSSIRPLVPVLRDNFWLSIHVPTITLSYASIALSLGLGHIILGNYLFTPQAKERITDLSKLNYRVIQIGVLLLTTGIILGGIWAHFSWGRFWGWDPKETWALIALLCYLVPLHGRLVGWLGDFGMAAVSVICFNAVLMAWYGVNFVLGTGLHSYGFSTGGSELIVGGVVTVDLLFVLAAFLRYRGRQTLQESTSELPAQPSEAEVSIP
ncbi:MAG: cytochrome c biogenesis protein [Microcoleaceae cyanobacterium]